MIFNILKNLIIPYNHLYGYKYSRSTTLFNQLSFYYFLLKAIPSNADASVGYIVSTRLNKLIASVLLPKK